MIRIVLFIAALGIGPMGVAQPMIDSLLGALTHKADSNDCLTYQRLAFALAGSQPNSARQYAYKALQLAQELRREKSEITSLNAIGLTHYYQGHRDTAAFYWRRALQKALEANEKGFQFTMYSRMGIIKTEIGQHDSTQYFLEKALEIAEYQNDSSKIVACYTNLGVAYFRQGLYDKAIPSYFVALQWYEQNSGSDKAKMADIANNLSACYIDFEDWNKASVYARKGMAFARVVGYEQATTNYYLLMGIIAHGRSQYDSALMYYEKARLPVAKMPSQGTKAQFWNDIGQTYYAQRAEDSAQLYFNKVVQLSDSLPLPYSRLLAFAGLSKIETIQEDYIAAFRWARRALFLARKHESASDEADILRQLSLLHQRVEESDSAIMYLEEATALRDSLYSVKALQRINSVERLYERKEQQAQLRQARATNQLQVERLSVKESQNARLKLGITFIALLLLLVLLLLFYLVKTQNKLRIAHSTLLTEQGKLLAKTEELKASNEQLQETQAQLVQSEKLAGLGQLTAGIAHEMNNPINFVKAGIESLRFELDDVKKLLLSQESGKGAVHGEEAHELFKEIDLLTQSIDKGATRTADIVRGLKIYSRSDRGSYSQVAIAQSLDNCLLLLRNSYKDRIEVETHIDEGLSLEANAEKLDQVFMNLLNNSIQAMEGKGKLTIVARKLEAEVEVEVLDTGKGIPEDVQNRIFDPFFTTKAVGQGTGLGLSIALGIVKEHHGNIEVQSEPGKTLFTLRLPLRQPAT